MNAFLLIAAAACLLASAYYSGSEMGLYCLNRLRLRLRAEEKRATNARRLLRLANRRQETVLAILIGTNLANYLLTASVSAFLAGLSSVHPERAEFYTAAILSPLIFVFGDVVPKNWFQVQANTLMYHTARMLRASVVLFRMTGLLWLLQSLSRLDGRLLGQSTQEVWRGARWEILGLLREGAAEGGLTEEQTEIIERVMNLSTVRVGAFMIPRRRVVTVPVDATRAAFEQIARNYHFSRMPVLSRDRKTVLGTLNVLDVLADEDRRPLENLLRPPVVIQASDSAAPALVRLQRSRATLAIVTDPRRGFVGMVTLKDVVEEIFGELPAW